MLTSADWCAGTPAQPDAIVNDLPACKLIGQETEIPLIHAAYNIYKYAEQGCSTAQIAFKQLQAFPCV